METRIWPERHEGERYEDFGATYEVLAVAENGYYARFVRIPTPLWNEEVPPAKIKFCYTSEVGAAERARRQQQYAALARYTDALPAL